MSSIQKSSNKDKQVDQSKRWANNIINDKSKSENKPKDVTRINWTIIICVAILLVIVIVYFIYNRAEVVPVKENSIPKINDIPIIPIINNPDNTVATV